MSVAPRYRARVRHAAQLVCVCRNRELVKIGTAAMNDVCVIENGALVVDGDGKLTFVGTDAELEACPEFADATLFEHDVDASGKCVLPGIESFEISVSQSLPAKTSGCRFVMTACQEVWLSNCNDRAARQEVWLSICNDLRFLGHCNGAQSKIFRHRHSALTRQAWSTATHTPCLPATGATSLR